MQLGGGDGDVVLCNIRTRLCDLLCCRACTGCALLDKHTGTVAGANVRTTSRCVDVAAGGQCTVDIQLCINKVFFTAIIIFPRGISYRTEIAFAGVCIGNPFVTVINIDALALGHHQLGSLCNGSLHAGQQCCRLIDCDLSGLNIDGNVIVQRKIKVPGIDFRITQIQRQCVQLCIAVYREYQPVSCLIIILGKASGLHLEHTVISDKGDFRCKDFI